MAILILNMMDKIKANDLRIGNLHEGNNISIPRLGIHSVLIEGKPCNAITAYGIHLVDAGELEFIPLRLSDEWLVRFGFVKDSFDFIIPAASEFVIPSLRIHNFTDKFYADSKYGVTLRFVHQLQNFFYSVTGHELEIK